MNREILQVAAIENGTVIDHIPSDKIFEVVNLLHLENVQSEVTVGFNLKSEQMGRKSIIKIANKFFTDNELNQLAVVTPNVTLCIIRNYDIVEKKTVTLPDELVNVIKCKNPKCITNNEPMATRFSVIDKAKGICRCDYCNNLHTLREVKLVNA